MKIYKYVCRIRGIYKVDEYEEVIAGSFDEADEKLSGRVSNAISFHVFTVTKCPVKD